MNTRKTDLLAIQELFACLARKGGIQWKHDNPTSLSITHVLILEILHNNGPQRPSVLAEELQITTGGITGLTNKLVNEGLIQRSLNDQDRRVIFLEITPLGSEQLRIAFRHRDTMTDRLFGKLHDTDVQELRRILQSILQHINGSAT